MEIIKIAPEMYVNFIRLRVTYHPVRLFNTEHSTGGSNATTAAVGGYARSQALALWARKYCITAGAHPKKSTLLKGVPLVSYIS